MLLGLFAVAVVVFVIAYNTYGKFMAGIYGLSDDNKTPAEAMYDGVDYCPAHPAVLLGHHFSSIAGAGPITGPITAANMFGWLPTYLWCVIGSAFLGGPHDMGGLVASMRHEGKSVGEVVDRWIGRKGKVLFLLFTIILIILVVAVFLQLSAESFAADPAVAFSSTLYIFMAVAFGILIYRLNCPLWLMTVIMVPIIIYACWFGNENKSISDLFSFSGNPALEFRTGIDSEETFQAAKATDEVLKDLENFEAYTAAKKALSTKNMEAWRWVLVVYIILASVLPVWLLLQPRDYLASYFLYFAVIIGGIGMVMGSSSGLEVKLPAFKSVVAGNGDWIWPMLFITVACGALSGFHALVGSGTTSKQIRKEKDSLLVGYGAMLIEGIVATIAIGTIMISGQMIGNPTITYATGFGRFAEIVGIDPIVGRSLGLLAMNSFLLTSLDTATRLGRYLIQELFNMKIDRYSSTVAVVAAAMGLLVTKTTNLTTGAVVPTWAALWPMFGSANQLVGALVLLGVAVWVKRALKKRNDWLMYPMWFMLVTTCAALGFMIKSNLVDPMMAEKTPNWLLGGLSIVLLILALAMVQQAFSALKRESA
ncbi:MAG: carbon starvation protein A [Synergistaceae bacterium]|jgi:carbon starvation protein|nr:carbon starvation protein A [Synergistaceae bacterium]